MLQTYAFFHLNLLFSSVEEEEQVQIIKKCYTPLLDLIEANQIPLGVEMSGATIQRIEELDSTIIERIKNLIQKDLVTLVGSGYSQIIGPLVPPEINRANLRIGNQIYQDFFGIKPRIFLVNEQAFSSSLVEYFNEIKAQAIIVEWNNPSSGRLDWERKWQYYPQHVKGNNTNTIPIVWNNSLNFQKFQAYAHQEIELSEYWEFIEANNDEEIKFFPFYGSDAEVFDYRTNRYKAEVEISENSEWDRINSLIQKIKITEGYEIVPISSVLKYANKEGKGFAYNDLRFTTAKQPVTVKKQPKYNLTRWGVTGRNDFGINTRCYRILKKLNEAGHVHDDDMKELCYLWSSDFRTHITSRRWKKYLERLSKFEKKLNADKIEANKNVRVINQGNPSFKYQGRMLIFNGRRLEVGFNRYKGMAIEYYKDKEFGPNSLFGTLSRGYFDDITWTFDYFSGHLVYDTKSNGKLTDLGKVTPKLSSYGEIVEIQCDIAFGHKICSKRIFINESEGTIKFYYRIKIPKGYQGSLRLGYITINPDAFNLSDLHYKTHNGGVKVEKFKIENDTFEHGRAISKIVSAQTALGMTGGMFSLGDKQKKIKVSFKNSDNAFLGLMQKSKIGDKNFFRFCLTAEETDDTSRNRDDEWKEFSYTVEIVSG